MLHKGPRRGLLGPRGLHLRSEKQGPTRLGAEWMANLCLEPSATVFRNLFEIMIGERIQYFHWRKGQEDQN